MNDLISVIVPVYNTGAPLRDCLDSILSQSYTPIEIIVVDDGSTDRETIQICDKYAADNQSVKLIRQTNSGPSKARNVGIAEARGEFIAFVDSDDRIDPDAYANLHRSASCNGVDLVLGFFNMIGARKSFTDCQLPDGVHDRTTILPLFLRGFWHSACTNLYRASLIKHITFPLNEINEDFIFNFEVLMACKRIAIFNRPFYHYIRRENSRTSAPATMRFLDWVKHTERVRVEVRREFGDKLRHEADFQYLYSLIVLCNKCVLNIADGHTGQPSDLYDIVSRRLRHESRLIFTSPCLSARLRLSAMMITLSPNLYKVSVTILKKLKKMKDLVTVLMSVHNEPAPFIDTAVGSICAQTYNDIELIIIDDASTPETFSHLQQLEQRHPIIRLYRNGNNIGLTATLNKGLALARGKYIARMDADDYSCPSRLAEQVAFLESRPEIDIVGTGVVSFGQKVIFMSPMNGSDYNNVRADLFFMSSLCHPSVMMRKEFLDRTGLRYDENVKKGQDYDLWERASVEGKLAVLPTVSLYYRLHQQQITSTNRADQETTALNIIKRRLNRLGIVPNDDDIRCHNALRGAVNGTTVKEIRRWVDRLIEAADKSDLVDTDVFTLNLRRRLVLAKMKRHRLPAPSELAIAFGIIRSRAVMTSRLNRFKKLFKSLPLSNP